MHGSVVTSLLLFVLAARGDSASVGHEAEFLCGEDAVLRCPAEAEPGVNYRAATWYKVSEAPSQQLTGLVMKRLTPNPNNDTITRYKGLTRHVELLGDSQSLLLPNVSLEDAGRYLCLLFAPLGHENKQREIHLNVYEHPEDGVRRYEENGTLYLILALFLLILAFLMFYVSYVCLRNALISHKNKFSKVSRLKTTQKIKHLIVSLEPKGVVSRILPQEYV